MLSAIKDIKLPDSFQARGSAVPAFARSFESCYVQRKNSDVQIVLFFRGTSAREESAARFRLLLQNPGVLFDHLCKESAEPEMDLQGLRSLLGNVGNNQLSNKTCGAAGPRFFLERLEVMRLNNKPLLCAQGYFHGIEGEPQSYFKGLYFEGTESSPHTCRIEELIFQAPDPLLFNKYLPDFERTAASICWQD